MSPSPEQSGRIGLFSFEPSFLRKLGLRLHFQNGRPLVDKAKSQDNCGCIHRPTENRQVDSRFRRKTLISLGMS